MVIIPEQQLPVVRGATGTKNALIICRIRRSLLRFYCGLATSNGLIDGQSAQGEHRPIWK